MVGWLKATVIIQPIHYEQNSSEDGKKFLEIGRLNRIYSKSESEVWEREFKGDSKVFGLSAEKMFPLARLGWSHSSFEREDQKFTFRKNCWESCCTYARVHRKDPGYRYIFGSQNIQILLKTIHLDEIIMGLSIETSPWTET